jgi:hypothetical protein
MTDWDFIVVNEVFYRCRKGNLGLEIYDRRSCFWRNLGDRGRQGYFDFLVTSRTTGEFLRARCPIECPICHGNSPGCLIGSSRYKSNLKRYNFKLQEAIYQFNLNNIESLSKIKMMRSVACMSYQKAIIFGSFKLQKIFIYPVTGVFMEKKSSFYSRRLPFQNSESEEGYLTWLKEENGVVLSPKQRRNLLCIGAISRVLARLLIFQNDMQHLFRTFATFEKYLLERLFGYGSLRRLILAGGLDWKYLEANKQFLDHYYICK